MNQMNDYASYQGLNLGDTKPISVPMELVEVEISELNLFGDFAKAFVKEAYRKNPLRAEQVALTEEELVKYVKFLVKQRIDSVNGTCAIFRKLKALYMPCWIQYNLSMIGKVILRDIGLTLVPVVKDEEIISYEEAMEISSKIGAFEDDLQIVKDAMPRSEEGNPDVMSTALIADYVRSIKKVQHVASTYVTAFMGLTLRKEAAMQVLYRVQYDDIEFIRSALISEKRIYS